MKKLVLAGLFLISGLTMASAQIKLSFNPEKGKKYEYQQEMIQNLKQSVMGQEIPMETEMSTTYLMEIKDKTPQETQAQFTYQDFVFIVSSPMMKMMYDSKNPTENPSEMDQMLSKMFSKMIGQSIMVVIAPNGSVKSVTGMDAIFENMINSVNSAGQPAAQMAAQLKQQFSDVAQKNSFEQLTRIYPPNAVKVGDSWNVENTMAVANMNSHTNMKYTLKEVKKNIATIAVEGDVEMTPGMGVEGKLSGTQAGTMQVDTKTGLTVSGETTQNIKGTIKAQGMDVQMDMNMKGKLSIKEVK